MKYLVRQRLFALNDSFYITDQEETAIFKIEGKIFSLGNKLNIYDVNGKKCIYIEQKLFKLLSEYEIYEGDRVVARIKKQFTLLKPKINIQSDYGNFTIEGNVFAYNFSILRDGVVVARVNKKLISFSDVYSVNISEGEKDDFILALVIVIDQIFHDDNHNNS